MYYSYKNSITPSSLLLVLLLVGSELTYSFPAVSTTKVGMRMPWTKIYPTHPSIKSYDTHRYSTRNRILTLASSKSQVDTDTTGNRLAPSSSVDDLLKDFIQPGPNLIPLDTEEHSKIQKEFYSMMREFADFSPKDIACVPDPRYRALYEGVVSGANEPLVMNAFCIVFEDMLPLRVAGRMIYKHLKSTMEECIKERDSKEQFLVNAHGFDIHTLNHGRKAFMAIMQDDTNSNADGQMTMGTLIESGIVDTIVELLEFESFDEFVKVMDADEDEKLTFEKFMVGLQRCKGDSSSNGASCDVNCDLSQVLNEIIQRMKPIEAAKKETSIDSRKKKYSERFDGMVASFEEWEDLVPSGDGRMLEVLKGSFAGAKNPKIVKALKIVYMDYSALRVGGDLVFKLMEKLVARRQRKVSS